MTYDPDNQTSTVYNQLNLPQEIVINNTSAKAKNYYTYSATGVKLKVVSRSDESLQAIPITETRPGNDGLTAYKTTDYVANFIYEDNNLKRILVDNGYIENNNYYFYVRDHLGNNRIVADSEGSVLQSVQYYPFGLEFAGGIGQSLQTYKYGGKELDSDHNLNLYDFVARQMNHAVPRFTSIDPLAEKKPWPSPYAYGRNNPLRFIDPDGMDEWEIK